MPIKVRTGLWFGLDDVNDDGTIQNDNEYDMFADMSSYPTVAPVMWPVATVAYGTEHLVLVMIVGLDLAGTINTVISD